MGSIFPDQNPVGRPGIDDGHGCSSSIGRGVRATLMPSSSADALLFDLGRVVIDIDFNRAFSRWAGHARCDQKLIRDRFRHDIAYKRHERGEIDSQEFFANRRASLGIDISDAQLLDGWNSILVAEMPGVSELLAKAAGSFSLYAFTNSNREHEQYWSKEFSGILRQFQRGLRVVDDWIEKARSRAVRLCCQGNRRVGRPYCVL
jgi:FMN phosphatase YigB (HAD superfamily)